MKNEKENIECLPFILSLIMAIKAKEKCLRSKL